ncbi:trigger factor, partial [bacterium]|nr:trigger factor [bacterium]
MDYQIQREENWHHVISVHVPPEQVKPELDAKYAELKNIRLEGFRKGRVPTHLVKKMYGKQVEADVFRPFISEAYQTIFKENEFDLLDSPELVNLHFDEQQGLTFEFQFDVRPVIPAPDYQGLSVDRYIFSVSEDDVAQTLEVMRRQNAMVYNVEGEAQAGHFVIADLQELDVSGVPILGQRLEDRVLELKDGEEITAQLVGIKAGEERRVQLTMEKPVESQLLQMQTPQVQQVYYSVAVKEIKERRLPELDDEFAKDMGEFENLQALKKAVLDRLNNQAQS